MLRIDLDMSPDLQKYLFDKGFCVTEKPLSCNLDQFPFYGNWTHTVLGGLHFYVHCRAKLHTYTAKDTLWFLVGHAYDPFTMEIEETKILEKLSETDQPQPIIDELTGVFLIGRAKTGEIAFQLDASGMQYGCYGVIGYKDATRPPVIGNDVTISCGAVVVGPITIGDHVTIGANAVVVKDLPSDSVWGGVPAKRIR